jgi:hypothetical protein
MASSTPLRSISADSSLPDLRSRSLSVSSPSQASNSVTRESLSRRSETPKAKRKTLSNRSIPYTSPRLLRASQSKNSTITIISDNQELDDRSTSSSIDVNGTSSSIDVNVIHPSPQQNQLDQEQDPFERSSDDEQEVSHFETVYAFLFVFSSIDLS